MTQLLQHSSMALAIATFGLLALAPTSTQAAIVGGDFDVEIDFGPLTGETFSGSFSFDDASLTGVGDEFLALTSFTFSFDGTNFALADLDVADVGFFDGTFLGLDVADTGNTFSFVPGSVDISDAGFDYEVTGSGIVTYDVDSAPVPEPMTLLGSLAAVGVGATLRRRSQT